MIRSLFAGLVLGASFVAHLSAQRADSRLTFYGYFDVELEAVSGRGAPAWSFDQHHVNLISIFNVDPRIRVFVEVEWEHGPEHEEGVGSGDIVLERGFVEYKLSDALVLQAGKHLSPFGLYNLRHDATPTFLFTKLPEPVYGPHENPLGGTQTLIPESGTGIQAFGSLFLSRWEAEYALHLTNGRGPAAAEQDNNMNKAIGGRIEVHAPGNVVSLGASYYGERNGKAADTRQRVLGLDLVGQYHDFVLEAEFIAPRLERADSAGAPDGTFQRGTGFYVQASQPLPITELTPFVRYEFSDHDTRSAIDGERTLVAGLNFAAGAGAFLKTEVHFQSFQDPLERRRVMWISSIAVAF